jgi:hypothetical protein
MYRCVATDANSVPSEAPSNTVYLTVLEPIITDAFTTGAVTGRVDGTDLDGQATEYGDATWIANSGAIFGEHHLTNRITGNNILAEVPISTTISETYDVLSVSANLLMGEADWIGVGFSDSGLASFATAGTSPLRAQVFADGRVKVKANDLSIFNQVILDPSDLAVPIHVRVDYNSAESVPRVWINNSELSLSPSAPLGVLETAGINAKKGGGFTDYNMIKIDDFALSGSEEVPYPTFEQGPASQWARLGFDVDLHCEVSGGVAPYAFQWSRAGEVITTGEDFTVTTGSTLSSLTLHNYDLSLEGQYMCEVLDSRHGGGAPLQAMATIYSLLPDFKILWGGVAGSTYHVAEVFDLNNVRQNEVITSPESDPDQYVYELDVAIIGAEDIATSLSFPMTVWGKCHLPGHEFIPTSTVSELATVNFSGGAGGHVRIPFSIPDDCIVDGNWGLLSLIVDINAQQDPQDPFQYPESIWEGVPVLAEPHFSSDNRGILQSWIPVSKPVGPPPSGPDDDNFRVAVSTGDSYIFKFDNGSTPPQQDSYPTNWTYAEVQSTPYIDALRFHLDLWQPCLYINRAIPGDYQPYMAWNTTLGNYTTTGAMIRYRKKNSFGAEDTIWFGETEGRPPTPVVTLPQVDGQDAEVTDVPVFGPSGNKDSSNLMSWANRNQWHVLTWAGASFPFEDDNVLDDGVASIVTPQFPGGEPTGGDGPSYYIGFRKDGDISWVPEGYPCSLSKIEEHFIDSVRIWGSGGGGGGSGGSMNYMAGKIHYQNPSNPNDYPELPSPVGSEVEFRLCHEIGIFYDDPLPPPSPPEFTSLQFGTVCVDDDDMFEENEISWDGAPIETIAITSSTSESMHCLPEDSLVSFEDLSYQVCPNPSESMKHLIRGCLDDPDEPEGQQGDNCLDFLLVALDACPIPFVTLP